MQRPNTNGSSGGIKALVKEMLIWKNKAGPGQNSMEQ